MTANNPIRRASRRTNGNGTNGHGSNGNGRVHVGDRLRDAREVQGLDLYRVERDTKIRHKFLEALEGGEYADLPGDVYTRGFLRNYATYLGLDPDEIIDEWRTEFDPPAVRSRHARRPAATGSAAPRILPPDEPHGPHCRRADRGDRGRLLRLSGDAVPLESNADGRVPGSAGFRSVRPRRRAGGHGHERPVRRQHRHARLPRAASSTSPPPSERARTS